MELELKMMKIKKIKPNPKNPRVHPPAHIDKLAKSIKEFGFTSPVLISKDNIALAGHARVKAAEQLGMKEVPVIQLDIDGNRADAYMIADNKLMEGSKWDAMILKDLLEEIDTGEFDMSITGFGPEELEGMFSNLDLDDFFEADAQKKEPEEPKTCTCPECGHIFEP